MINPISITAISSISALGDNHQDIWEEYKHSSHKLSFKKFENTSAFVGAISKDIEFQISQIKTANKHYKDLDKSVLMAIIAARTAFKNRHPRFTACPCASARNAPAPGVSLGSVG